jgi:hypothetical protein
LLLATTPAWAMVQAGRNFCQRRADRGGPTAGRPFRARNGSVPWTCGSGSALPFRKILFPFCEGSPSGKRIDIMFRLSAAFLSLTVAATSSSHALIGGVIGSTLAAAGGHAVKWHGLISKVIIPAALVAATGTYLLYRISRSLTHGSLSTTHVATGSIIGTGLGKKGADVRWNVAGRMATAWVLTLPCAALVGAGACALARGIGGSAGICADTLIMIAIAAAIYLKSRTAKVDRSNVNDEWADGPGSSPEAEPAAA